MAKIQVLPDIIANKIAAGEVVERPASVVKELLENSLDAGSTQVKIETQAGGKTLIRIIDNGEGMLREDAMLAFERHATSKLRNIDDLEQIKTLGFRGEALPSIASVAKVSLRTKTTAELEGTEIEIEGGRILAVNDLAWPGGTEFEIKDLFFNVPARRKFLKSDTTENFHISNLITNYALANPQISFNLWQNGREVIATSKVETLRERAYQLFGSEFIENLMEVQERGEISLHGFVSKPQEQRASRDSQYLFVNGRFVKDRVLTKAISDAYKNVIPPGSYPVVMLMIDIASEEVDVNVHPAKTEVRFRRPYVVSESVASAIRAAFSRTKPFASFPIKQQNIATKLPEIKTPEILQNKPITKPVEAPEIEIAPTESTIFDLPDVEDPFETASTKTVSNPQFDLDFTSESEKRQEFSKTNNIEVKKTEIATPTLKDNHNLLEILASPACSYQISQTEELPSTKAIKILGQLHNSYIVAIDKEGLLLIDQHVAHERILFEIHLSRILERNLEVQEMLIPETMDLSPAQYSAFEMLEKEFETSGFDLMPLSGRTIAIKAVPVLLSSSNARKLILELLSTVEKERRNISLEYFQREIAASIACHAAIKVNMQLTIEKMQWLIDELMKTDCPTNCPHGRPIILRFSMRDIEKGFKRI
ncbi:MAG: DNA mismatch repair endonuclease MutL [Blastocatellia bacterium]|nr:DNA mismatch repair endonuclease MutL [Blastocatellia bacterium]